jgi:hypothetical protein
VQHVHTVIAKAAIVQLAHHVRSIVIARLAHRAASVIAPNGQLAASVIVLRVQQDRAQVASPVVQVHVDHRVMASVLSVAPSTKKVHQEQD